MQSIGKYLLYICFYFVSVSSWTTSIIVINLDAFEFIIYENLKY